MAMITITALWKPSNGSEKVRASGPCGQQARYMVLTNTNKRGPKDPDFYLVLADRDRDDRRPTTEKQASDHRDRDEPTRHDDDIPF
jgi:hypothetical protein